MATVMMAGGSVTAAVHRRKPNSARWAAATATSESTAKEDPPEPPFDPAKQPGVTLPLMYFDPAGFAKVGDKEGFYNLRTAELKHGRVAMMAALGSVVQHWIRFPGFDTIPNGVKAVISPPGTYGLAALVLACGAMELIVWKQDPEKEPGDFGDPLGVGQYYEEWRNRELNNGRMGMVAILAIISADLVTGKDGIDQIWQPLSNLPVE